jgi:hypothetical protein
LPIFENFLKKLEGESEDRIIEEILKKAFKGTKISHLLVRVCFEKA